MTRAEAAAIPPEISAEQAAGVPTSDCYYRCPDCGAQFWSYAKYSDHRMEEWDEYHDET